MAADYEFFLRMVMLGKKFVKLHTHGVTFRRGGRSTMNMNASIREASEINWLYFGRFSPKHFLFILHNHVPSILGNIKLLLYKWIGRNKTAKLRRLWKRLKG
ncbi:MAG: hypothetical protein GY950_23940 [bacterium]|nr:hypothetical protein [bacterium]